MELLSFPPPLAKITGYDSLPVPFQGYTGFFIHMSRSTGLNKVVISGGVFQNRLLTELIMELLAEEGIALYRHKEVPPNDGGISLGQAVAGNEVTKNVPGSTA